MITILQCPDPAGFDDSLRKATEMGKTQGADVFLLAFAERSAETGVSWCPDCQSAYPNIMAALMQRQAPSVLLELTVQRSLYKNNPSYPYRKHEKLQLKAVPQLYRVADWQTLIEDECKDYRKVHDFMK